MIKSLTILALLFVASCASVQKKVSMYRTEVTVFLSQEDEDKLLKYKGWNEYVCEPYDKAILTRVDDKIMKVTIYHNGIPNEVAKWDMDGYTTLCDTRNPALPRIECENHMGAACDIKGGKFRARLWTYKN